MRSLVVLALLFLGANASHFFVCPSKDSFPTSKDVQYEATSPSCLEISIPPSFSAFFVHLLKEVDFPKTSKIRHIPLKFFPSYSVVIVANDYLRESEMLLIGNEKQIIQTTPLSPISPFSTPILSKFRKEAAKDDIINSLSKDEYLLEMRRITGDLPMTVGGRQVTITTRYTGTQGNLYAADYFFERFENLGYEVFFQPFSTSKNIIAVKTGTTLPDEIVVLGAHMDSTSPSASTSAPGCVDNGSGSEAVMSIAKAFANTTTERSIHFILFGAEEQGLIGSNYYVRNLGNNGYNVVTSLVMDMIGYSEQYYGIKIETSSSRANTQLGDLMAQNIRTYSPDLTILRSTNYFGSDHVPFIDAGIPCFLAIEQDDVDYPGYHRTTDQVNYLSVDQSIDIARALAGTLYDSVFA